MIQTSINMVTTDARSQTILVPAGMTSVSIQIVADSNGFSSAVVSMQWSLGKTDDLAESWSAFTPALTFDSSTTGRRNVPVTSLKMLRLATTTSATDADSDAPVLVEFFP